MSRKHYILIAAAIKASKLECDPAAVDQHSRTAKALADALALDNPSFNRDRFLAACGLEA